MFSVLKNVLLTGVGRMPQLMGGLLIELPEMERGGVDGYTYPSLIPQSVSSDSECPSSWNKKSGLWYVGRGDALGVIVDCIGNGLGCMYICESDTALACI